ncbi:flagellar biosynthetic protein FliR [Thalassobaculum salexigens]|uniref:flagellar biosynthetic protein FliR n=1 Tax=Thalassobaculum salexigens TaxID=455360 RepID=UPI00041C1953|nr:flagellar biosynthetic protein FliR [Thalassobaculum salexigens]
MPLQEYLPVQAYALMLVIARLGAMVFLLPGIGESFVSSRIRMMFLLTMALVVSPTVMTYLPTVPPSLPELFLLVFIEVMIGSFFGLVGRTLLLTLSSAGMILSFSTGLANAQVFNPSIQGQGTSISLLLSVLAIMVVMAADMHHMLILALIDSYTLFPPGAPLPIDDMSLAFTRLVADSFEMAVQLSAPFIVFSLVFFVTLGVVSRLMPQLQIFFIGLPIQILMGFTIMIAILGTMVEVFLRYYEDGIASYLVPG